MVGRTLHLDGQSLISDWGSTPPQSISVSLNFRFDCSKFQRPLWTFYFIFISECQLHLSWKQNGVRFYFRFFGGCQLHLPWKKNWEPHSALEFCIDASCTYLKSKRKVGTLQLFWKSEGCQKQMTQQKARKPPAPMWNFHGEPLRCNWGQSLLPLALLLKFIQKKPCLDDFTSLQKLAICMELRDTMISYAMNLIERRQKPWFQFEILNWFHWNLGLFFVQYFDSPTSNFQCTNYLRCLLNRVDLLNFKNIVATHESSSFILGFQILKDLSSSNLGAFSHVNIWYC
jgi:hypothetical protein